ncbi:MAG: DUF3566 domain-containing protein [Microthrixaceae bacterium]|nr:DUF3566 domain-containing protein [Acidimicrobiales bacterium]MCB9403240.1 DUF3566 domain-containing protein [Microthrixaceae bacterium]
MLSEPDTTSADMVVLGAAAVAVAQTDPTVVTEAGTPTGSTAVIHSEKPAGTGEPTRRQRRSRPEATDPDVVKIGRRTGRRVHRVVRRIDLWSVLKLSIVLYTCLYAAVMATLALVWGVAYSSGQIDKVQSFMADVGLGNYRFYGDRMWRACAMIGAIGVLVATVVTVLTTALVNVISEATGGIRFTIIEEDPRPRRRR